MQINSSNSSGSASKLDGRFSKNLTYPLKENLIHKLPFKRISLRTVPITPGVYFYFNREDRLIYVGKAKSLRYRIRSYFIKGIYDKTDKLSNNISYFSYISVSSEIEALLLEAKMIQKYKPYYNISLRDDKSPSYVYITSEKYPRLVLKRERDNFRSKVKFGPFINTKELRYILRELRKIVPFCDHPLLPRPCIYYQMGLCDPCPAAIEKEIDKDKKYLLIKRYRKNVRDLKLFFNGNFQKFKSILEKEMLYFSRKEDYERATLYKQRINILSNLLAPTNSPEIYSEDPYFLKKLRFRETNDLSALLQKYGIKIDYESKIECYDISHLHGTNSAGSMVVFEKGEAEKKMYRHFRLRVSQNNDFESMREVAKRRSGHFKDWGKPDLIIVDGGKSQITAFRSVFLEFGVPVIGISKRMEELIIPVHGSYKKTRLKGLKLYLIQRIRNEAHRFAQRYHHKLIKKNLPEMVSLNGEKDN